MKIEVTAEDIAKGKRLSACSCPIAIAATRAGVVAPEVYPARGADESQPPWHGEMIHGIRRTLVLLPWAASRFASAFDEGRHVEPFAFDLDVTP